MSSSPGTSGSGNGETYELIKSVIKLLPGDLEIDTPQPPGEPMPLPVVDIIEQPKSKVRFRYECEGRSAGAILGVYSSNDNKTYPRIRIHNYRGVAYVIASCVTDTHHAHPHKLVDKDGGSCKDGVFHKKISSENNEDMEVTLANVGIQCMKKKDIDASLHLRESIKVDPFKKGFEHRKNVGSINLNAVKICFQVFIPSPIDPDQQIPLAPVVTDIIKDAKSNADLMIYHLSHSSDSVAGGTQMILTCDKVNKEHIRIYFSEEQSGWREKAIFTEKDVHKQYAIVFKTPAYRTLEITEPVDVWIELYDESTHTASDAKQFKYTPMNPEDGIRRKKQRKNYPEYYNALRDNVDPDNMERRMATRRGGPSPRPGTSTQGPQVKDEAYDSLYPMGTSPGYSRTPSPYEPIQQLPLEARPTEYVCFNLANDRNAELFAQRVYQFEPDPPRPQEIVPGEGFSGIMDLDRGPQDSLSNVEVVPLSLDSLNIADQPSNTSNSENIDNILVKGANYHNL